MTEHAIIADRISKAYQVGAHRARPDTLVGTLQSWLAAPIKNYQHIRSLTNAGRGRRPTNRETLWALQDVSFEVHPGEVVGIVGRNGAGKSTLLKILTRITDPTSGSADMFGRVSSLLEVGTGFHPELTGRENVYMNGTILGMTKREIDRKFDQIVEFAGVERFLETPIKRYSSGMQVRLAFSVAAHLEPEILIIDEVLAVGDAEFQKRCIGKMREVAGGGRTVLFVSHNMSAIGQLCTSGMLLSDGKVMARGELHEVIEAYMKDLFHTHSEVGDDSTNVSVKTSINGCEDEHVWDHGARLTVHVTVETKETMQRPAIDLYFHSSSGRMIFAQSDRFVDQPMQSSKRWSFEFEFINNGFVSDYMTVDVGFRYCSSTQYLGLWRSVAAIALGPVPVGHSHGRECPVSVPCAVQVQEMAA
ncbi:MAG: ABC transporter ATP-binding protein [Planctomycetota bacterium]